MTKWYVSWMRDSAFVQEYNDLDGEFALFDELLRAWKEAGLTQAEVAARMATQPSVVASWKPVGDRRVFAFNCYLAERATC